MLNPARTLVRCVTETATSPPTPNKETFTAAPTCPRSPLAREDDESVEGCTVAGVSVEGADGPEDIADWPNPARQLEASRLQTMAVERTNGRITVCFLLELRFVVWRKLNIAPPSQGSMALR